MTQVDKIEVAKIPNNSFVFFFIICIQKEKNLTLNIHRVITTKTAWMIPYNQLYYITMDTGFGSVKNPIITIDRRRSR